MQLPKDDRLLCLFCGQRVDGLFNPHGHTLGCPVLVLEQQASPNDDEVQNSGNEDEV